MPMGLAEPIRPTGSIFEESDPEIAANAANCLVHQANYLLDRQLASLEKKFLAEGGFTERLYRKRSLQRRRLKE